MLKLARYLKRYAAMLALGVVLLFGQALLDLSLPNMMSRIVNVGIQKSGIEEIAPKAISEDAYKMLLLFMSEADLYAIQDAYTHVSALDAEDAEAVLASFPLAAQQGALAFTATGDAAVAAGAAFGRTGYALAQFLEAQAEKQGLNLAASNANSAEFDLGAISQLLSGTQAPKADYEAAIAAAAKAPATLTEGVAAALNKSFYRQLGADTGRMQTGFILRIGGIMVALSLLMVACAVGAGFCFARLGAGVARDLRRDVFAKVTGFSSAQMDAFSTSSLITRTTNDVNQVQMLYTMGMRMLVYAPLMGIGGVVMAFSKSPGMSWIIGVGVGFITLVILILMRVVMPRFKKMQTLIDRLNQVARENLSGIMVVRAFSNQKFQEERFDKANTDLTKNSLFVGRAMNIMMPTMMLVMNGLSLFIVWLGAGQIAASAIQVGDLMAFLQYAMQVILSFLFIAMIFVIIPRASVSAERINAVLRSESAIKDEGKALPPDKAIRGEVQFRDVSFRYGGADEDVLTKVSFTARPGQTTAFIGATGSGKSTLVNLIPRFYDVTGGAVLLDGVNVKDIPLHTLRNGIGYVPQKGLLFSGSVASNLRFGSEDASDEALREAAGVAQASEFISAMPGGFNAEVAQGGASVSGGQRQRLSIARALVKKAPVYIFDDSFSALDFATDAKLRAALGPYTQTSTVLIVAQRVSTIMNAEQIVVLDEGQVVGIGRHRELLESCEAYREIAESQLSREELA